MRVLVVSNLYPPDIIGGYELSCSQMSEQLRTRGHEVLVLTSAPRRPCPAEPGVKRSLRLANVYDSALARSSPRTRRHTHARANLLDPDNVYALLRTIDEFRPDVVYFWNLVGIGGVALVTATRYVGVPWVWQLGDSIPSSLCVFDGQINEVLAAQFSRQLDGHFLVCSEHVVDEIQLGPRLGGRVEIMPNWIAGPRPAPRTAWRPLGALRLVSAGQVSPVKGTGIAVETVARLVAEGLDDVTLDIYGGGDPGWLEAIILRLGMSDHVRYLGPRPHHELLALFGDYDVFLFPTWSREPFAVAQLEAASRGCLCVITRDCGNAEWMVDGVHCIKAARDAPAFAEAVHDIARREDVWPIAARAQAVVLRDFHLERVAERVERALAENAHTWRPARERSATAYAIARQSARLMDRLIEESG